MEGRRIMTRQTSKERLMEEDKKKDEESKTTSVENIEKGEVVVEREKGESRMEEIEIEVDRESVIGQDEESTSRLIQQLEQGKEGEASKAVVVEKESGMEMIMAFMKQELGVFRKEGQESIEKLGDRMDKGQEVLKQVLRNEQLQLNKNIEILTLHVNELEKGIERGIKEVRQDVIQDMDRWGNSLNEKIDKIGDELNEEKSQRDNQLAFMCDNIKRIEEVAAGDRIEIRKEIIVESQNMRQYVDKEIGVNNRKIDKKVNESINVIKGDIDTKIKQLKGNVREEMDQIKGEIGSNIEQFEGKCRDLNAEYSQLRTEVEYRSWGTANGGENQSFINLRCIERESPKFTKIGDRNPKEFIGELEKYLKQCQSQLGPRFNRDVEMGVVNSRGKKHMLIMVDVFSKYTKIYPCRKCNTQVALNCIESFVETVGKPVRLLADNATYFNNQRFKEGIINQGIKIIFCSIRHPQGNPSERYIQEVIKYLRILLVNEQHRNWVNYTGRVETYINEVPSTVTGVTPVLLMEGRQAERPWDTETIEEVELRELLNTVKERIRKRNERYVRNENKKIKKQVQFNEGDLVVMRALRVANRAEGITEKLLLPFSGPFKIGQRWGNTYELLFVDTDRVRGRFNIQMLYPYEAIRE